MKNIPQNKIFGNVLIIEDDMRINRMLSILLEHDTNLKTFSATDGFTGLKIFRDNDIDAVLLDLMLPGMSGEEVYEKLHEISPNIPIIVLTASESVNKSIKLMKMGVFDYIMKPFDNQKLVTIVTNAVGISRRRKKFERSEHEENLLEKIVVISNNEENIYHMSEILGSNYEIISFPDKDSLLSTKKGKDILAIFIDSTEESYEPDFEDLKLISMSSEVVIISKEHTKALVREALKKGATGFIYLPFKEKVLLQKVEQIRKIYHSSGNYHNPSYAEFGRLNTSILKSIDSINGKTIFITSPESGDGRSFISSNLAKSLARNSDQSVLLVDFDRNQPIIHNLFDISPNRGITEALAGVSSLEECIHPTEYPNLHILPSGLHNFPLNHFLTTMNIQRLINSLKNDYDIIIFDSSPINKTNRQNIDPTMVSQMMDLVYMVVTPRKTRKDTLTSSILKITESGGNVDGIIANNLFSRNSKNISDRLKRLKGVLYERSFTRRLLLRRFN